jgi:hypothetical protein
MHHSASMLVIEFQMLAFQYPLTDRGDCNSVGSPVVRPKIAR